MLTRLHINISNDVNMHATFCLTFANFFRVSEFIYIKVDIQTNDFENWFVTRNHVSLSKDNFTLDISISKIDIFKKNISILIATINDVVCFLKSFRHLFIEYSIKSDIFLFQIFDEFFKQHVTIILRRLLLNIDIKNKFLTHFFKREATTWVEIRDIFDDQIKTFDRWRFDNYLLYIDRDLDRILTYSKQFQSTQWNVQIRDLFISNLNLMTLKEYR